MTRKQIELMLAIDSNLKSLEELYPKSKIVKGTSELFIELIKTLNK